MNCRCRIARTLALVVACFSTAANGATLLVHEVRSGGTLDLQFPLSDYFQQHAAQGGNPHPTTGHALLIFPNNFAPARSWPILVVTSTADFERTSIMDAPFYQEAAMKEGWIVLATDATIRPRIDSVDWRLSILTAALQMMRKEWPQSAQWPVAFAGFSGGAKQSGSIAAMLAGNRGLRICGLFLTGINADRLSAAYKEYHPPSDFLRIPVWLSSGTGDQIARPGVEEGVYYSVKRTGFQQVRLEKFPGGHEVSGAEVQRALHWFRELGKF